MKIIYITNMRATIIHIKITKHIINPLHSSKTTQKYIIEKTKKINMFGMKERAQGIKRNQKWFPIT